MKTALVASPVAAIPLNLVPMPYRRLPNTDQARLRALRTAQDKSLNVHHSQLRFSQKLAFEVSSFAPIFEQTVQQYVVSKEKQSQASQAAAEGGRIARLYLSHYIQVFNMCVARGEIKPEARQLLGLAELGAAVPDLTSDQALIDWGRKVVDGEEQRMANGGGNRIYNPSIALVKVKMQLFEEQYNKHRDLLATIQKYHDRLDDARQQADDLILRLWNEVEASLDPIDCDEKRDVAISYGVVYFYRPQERQREFLGV